MVTNVPNEVCNFSDVFVCDQLGPDSTWSGCYIYIYSSISTCLIWGPTLLHDSLVLFHVLLLHSPGESQKVQCLGVLSGCCFAMAILCSNTILETTAGCAWDGTDGWICHDDSWRDFIKMTYFCLSRNHPPKWAQSDVLVRKTI